MPDKDTPMNKIAHHSGADTQPLPQPEWKIERVSSDYLDGILGRPFMVLDHGFVRVIDYMGDDTSVVQAARVSYGKGTKSVNNDRGLIRYLMKHKHTTPFEMCEIKFHIKLPMFVARQWIRHRMASVNEYSARYSILDKEFYIPRPEDVAVQSTENNQGRGDVLSPEVAEKVINLLKDDADRCYQSYESLTSDDINLARELARMNLTLNTYTQWYWKIDLHNLLHFLKLRADSHAQYEIRAYADFILNTIVKNWVPNSYEAFNDYVVNARTLSAPEIRYLFECISSSMLSFRYPPDYLSKREWKEFRKWLKNGKECAITSSLLSVLKGEEDD